MSMSALDNVVSYFSHCCDKTPDSSFRDPVHHGGRGSSMQVGVCDRALLAWGGGPGSREL